MKQPNLQLVSHILCPYVQRSIITLEEKNIPYTRTDIDLAHKPNWFVEKSPLGKVPLLLIDHRRSLFESAVICEYLDEITPGSLHPTDSFEKASHRAWIEFGSHILSQIASLYNAKSAAQFHAIHTEIQAKFQLLERELSGGRYFSGEKFHLIDAVYAPIFRYVELFDTVTPVPILVDLPQCQQWRNGLKQRLSVQKAVADDYMLRLRNFLCNRDSYLAQLMPLERSL